MTQIPLQLSLPIRYGNENFLSSASNEAAFAAISRWPDWPDHVLLMVGPPGSGKTHLCHIWARRTGARMVGKNEVASDPPGVAAAPAVIDDADGAVLPEAEFFHLLNLVRQAGMPLLITARQPPDRWGLRTPDLLSRLRLAPMVGISPPDDALMRSVLGKLFEDRQIRVDSTLIDYLTLRLDRSLESARTVVDALDAAALSRASRITRALAADVLKTLRLDDDEPPSC